MWDSGMHKKMDVACSDCHTVHGPPKTPAGYGTTLAGLGYSPSWEYAVCGKCHLDIKAQVQQEGPPPPRGRQDHLLQLPPAARQHESLDDQGRRASTSSAIRATQRRGVPICWSIPRLTRTATRATRPTAASTSGSWWRRYPNLCQDCHDQSHRATRYSRETLFTGKCPANQSFGRACLNCHVDIHGSNGSANPANGFNSGAYFFR